MGAGWALAAAMCAVNAARWRVKSFGRTWAYTLSVLAWLAVAHGAGQFMHVERAAL